MLEEMKLVRKSSSNWVKTRITVYGTGMNTIFQSYVGTDDLTLFLGELLLFCLMIAVAKHRFTADARSQFLQNLECDLEAKKFPITTDETRKYFDIELYCGGILIKKGVLKTNLPETLYSDFLLDLFLVRKLRFCGEC